MKLVVATLALITTSVFAETATEMWSIRNNLRHEEVTVAIKIVDNPGAQCQKESKNRGFGGFGMPVQACTFWSGKNCTIVVAPKVNNDIIGHEMRHCLQGAFH